jgi:hypothetical protein
MKKPGMRGKTLASTTRRPSVPRTRKSLVRTASGPVPILQVQEAWWPPSAVTDELCDGDVAGDVRAGCVLEFKLAAAARLHQIV